MEDSSDQLAMDDLLPADDIALLPSRDSQWLPPPKSIRSRLRRLRFLVAWLAMAMLGVSIVWSISWIQPQSSVAVSLVGAAYKDNLSLDLNIGGWNNLEAFRDLTNDPEASSGNHYQLLKPPVVLNAENRWDLDWDQASGDTLVVFVSAHGAADEKGPFLIANDAKPNDMASRISVRELIKKLKQLPAEKQKMLVLDATHFSSNWKYGILSNDFARAMRELNRTIIDVPNLVVMCASSTDQLSWQAQPWNETAFGHFFVEGLRGAANDVENDGRIDAADIYHYTRNAVSGWVQTHLQRFQRPMLLPLGRIGMQRAANLELALVNPSYQPTEPTAIDTEENSQVRKIWEEYHALMQQPLHPGTFSLARWRRYEQMILRYEQLVQANEMKTADEFVEEIHSLHRKIEWDQHRARTAQQGSLAIGPAVFSRIGEPEQVNQITDELWAAPSGQHGSIWRTALSNCEDPASLRVGVLSRLYERAMSDPSGLLLKANRIVDFVLDPIEPPPSEINFLRMLARSLPESQDSNASDRLVRQAMRLRVLGEQTAVSWQPGSHSYSEEVFPWIADQLHAADQLRLLGEDLLFADAEDRHQAADYLNKAASKYKMVAAKGDSVRTAFDTQNHLFRILPHLAEWISNTSHQLSTTGQERIGKFEELLEQTHILNSMLEIPNAKIVDTATGLPNRSLIEQTQLVSKLFNNMRFQFESWWKHQIAESHAASWHHFELALSLPYGKPKERLKMINQRAKMGRQADSLQQKQKEQPTPPPNLAALEMRQQRCSMNNGQINGRLALAMIGERGFNAVTPAGAEKYAQVKHRVRVFDVEQEWWKSMHHAGREISKCLNRLTDFSEGERQQNSPKQSIEFAACVSGLLGDAEQGAQMNCPSTVQRQHRQSVLFASLAQRSLDSRWFGPGNRPYYLDSARRYLRCAERLWDKNPQLTVVDDHISSAGQLVLKNPDRIDLTTESRVPFQIGISNQAETETPVGFPVLWVQESAELNIIRPTPGQRLIQQLVAGESPSLESCLLENPILHKVPEGLSKNSSSEFQFASFQKSAPNNEIEPIQVSGFFRGQRLAEKINVHLHRRPDLFTLQHQKPGGARLAVKASDQLHGLYGTGSGALAIVIDASGSMGAAADRQFDQSAKYFEATRALREVLQSLPDGIQLSVWIFGQAIGPDKTVRHAEQTISRVGEPLIWNSADSSQIETLMHNVTYPNVEPWNESPIVEALLAAKQDVIGNAGYKSVLLLTDGMDNRYISKESASNPSTSVVPDAIRAAFDHSGISLNVVGFKVENHETEQSRAQFQIVESFTPPGKYFEVRDSRRLADTLKSVLHQRVRYWVDDYSNHPLQNNRRKRLEVGQGSGAGQWYPDDLPPASYSLWTNINENPFRFQVNRGDQLVVELSRMGKNLRCSAASYFENSDFDRPLKSAAGWNVAALENRLVGSNQLSLLLGIEKRPAANATTVELVRPYDIWFQVDQQGAARESRPTVWSSNYEYPVPAWRVDVSSWPQSGDRIGRAAVPKVKVWWMPDRPTPPAVRFERGRDYQEISELVGRKVDVNGDSIVVTQAQVENRLVEIRKDVHETRPCLVVQLGHGADKKLWVRPQGADFEGSEQRYYDKTCRYTGIFWPVTPDQVNTVVSGLEIVSLSDLKRQAEIKGCHAVLDVLSNPRADDVAFPPLTGFSKY